MKTAREMFEELGFKHTVSKSGLIHSFTKIDGEIYTVVFDDIANCGSR